MDIQHSVDPAVKLNCVDCGIPIPFEVALYGEVVDIGGAGVHWLPLAAHEGPTKSCVIHTVSKGAIMVCTICEGKGCNDCGDYGIVSTNGDQLKVEAAKPRGRERVEKAPRKSEFEKQIQRGSYGNFLAMREATKPKESDA